MALVRENVISVVQGTPARKAAGNVGHQ